MHTFDLLRKREIDFDAFKSRRRQLGFTPDMIKGFTRTKCVVPMRHKGCVNTVKFNKSGSILVSGSDDRTVKLWNMTESCPSLIQSIKTKHRENIFCAELCPDNERLCVSCSADGSLWLNDVEENSTANQKRLLSADGMIHMFHFDVEQPNIIYSADSSGDITRIDLRAKLDAACEGGSSSSAGVEVLFSNYLTSPTATRLGYARHKGAVKCLAQSSALVGGSQLLVGGQGFSVGLLDLRMVRPAKAAVTTSPSAESAGGGFTPSSFVRLWGPQYLSPIPTYSNFDIPNDLSRSKDKDWLLSAVNIDPRYRDTPNHVIDVSVSGLHYSKDGKRFAVSYQGDQIYTFDSNAMPHHNSRGVGATTCVGGHVNHDTFLKTVSFFGPNDEYIVSGSDSGFLWIWDSRSGSLVPNQLKLGKFEKAEKLPPENKDSAAMSVVAEVGEGNGDGELFPLETFWKKRNPCQVLNCLLADQRTCNGVVPHPHLPLLASYGIDSDVKIFSYASPALQLSSSSCSVPSKASTPSSSSSAGTTNTGSTSPVLPLSEVKKMFQFNPCHLDSLIDELPAVLENTIDAISEEEVFDHTNYKRTVAGIRSWFHSIKSPEKYQSLSDQAYPDYPTDYELLQPFYSRSIEDMLNKMIGTFPELERIACPKFLSEIGRINQLPQKSFVQVSIFRGKLDELITLMDIGAQAKSSGNVAFKDKEMNVALEKYQKAHRYSSAAANLLKKMRNGDYYKNMDIIKKLTRNRGDGKSESASTTSTSESYSDSDSSSDDESGENKEEMEVEESKEEVVEADSVEYLNDDADHPNLRWMAPCFESLYMELYIQRKTCYSNEIAALLQIGKYALAHECSKDAIDIIESFKNSSFQTMIQDGNSSYMLTLNVKEQLSISIDAKIYFRQGLVLLALHKLSSALTSFSKAQKLQPQDVSINKKILSTKRMLELEKKKESKKYTKMFH